MVRKFDGGGRMAPTGPEFCSCWDIGRGRRDGADRRLGVQVEVPTQREKLMKPSERGNTQKGALRVKYWRIKRCSWGEIVPGGGGFRRSVELQS